MQRSSHKEAGGWVEEVRGLYHQTLSLLKGYPRPEKFVIAVLTALRYGLPIDVYLFAIELGLKHHPYGLRVSEDLERLPVLQEHTARYNFKANIRQIRDLLLKINAILGINRFQPTEYEVLIAELLPKEEQKVAIVTEGSITVDTFSLGSIIGYAIALSRRALGLKLNNRTLKMIYSIFTDIQLPDKLFSLIRKLAYFYKISEKNPLEAQNVAREIENLLQDEEITDYRDRLLEFYNSLKNLT